MRRPLSWLLCAAAIGGALAGFFLTSLLTREPIFFYRATAVIQVVPISELAPVPEDLLPGSPIICGLPVVPVKMRNAREHVAAKLDLCNRWAMSLDEVCERLKGAVEWDEHPSGSEIREIHVTLPNSRDSGNVASSLVRYYQMKRLEMQQRDIDKFADRLNAGVFKRSEALLEQERLLRQVQAESPVDEHAALIRRKDIARIKEEMRKILGELEELQNAAEELHRRMPVEDIVVVRSPLSGPTRTILNFPKASLLGALVGMILLPAFSAIGLSRRRELMASSGEPHP